MNKRKLVLVAVALCMVAILGFGGTLAYLTDQDHQVNTFTTGKVGLNLDEEIVAKQENDPDADNYGDFIATGEGRTDGNQEYAKVFPGNTILKDPTVTVDSDSEDAWVAVKIVITGTEPTTATGKDIYDLFGKADGTLDITTEVDGTPVFSGGLISEVTTAQDYHGGALTGYGNNKFFLYQMANKDDLVWRLWLFMKEPMSAGQSVTLFDTISVPASWDNDEIIAFNGLSIDIKAYGVQADGFADAYEAIANAFPTDADF